MDSDPNFETVHSSDNLADFIDELRSSLSTSPELWENVTLERYLEAMAAWVRDSGNYLSQEPNSNWRLVAMILAAARVYE